MLSVSSVDRAKSFMVGECCMGDAETVNNVSISIMVSGSERCILASMEESVKRMVLILVGWIGLNFIGLDDNDRQFRKLRKGGILRN